MVADAPVIGESYARHADTPAQTNAKALELMATDTSTETEAKAARKAGTVAFGGQIDPFAHIDQALEHVPATLPRRAGITTWSHRRFTCRRFRISRPPSSSSPRFPTGRLNTTHACRPCTPRAFRPTPLTQQRSVARRHGAGSYPTVHRAHRARRLGKQMRQQLKLKRILPALGVSQSQLAIAVELSPATVAQLVNHALWPRVRQHQLREATIQF